MNDAAMPSKPAVPRVAVVLTGSDRVSATPRCLDAILAHTPAAAEIVLIETPAPDFVRRAIAAAAARRPITVIESPAVCQNVQRNLALTHLGARDYYAFVDTDTSVGPGWLERLIACAESERADLVTPVFLYGEAEAGIVHMAGGRTLFRPDADGRPGMDELHDGVDVPLSTMRARLGNVPIDTGLIEFHCLLVAGRAIARIGSFDAALEGCMEHVDLSLDVARAGGRTLLCTDLAVACLHTGDYELCDAEPHAAAWGEEPSARTLRAFAAKHGLAPDGEFFHRQLGWNRVHRESIGVVRRPASRTASRTASRAVSAAAIPHTWSALARELADLGWSQAEIADTRRCHEIALAHCAGYVRADGAPFIERPIGAASVLAARGAPPLMIQAALLHRLYGEGDLGVPKGAAVAPAIRHWLAERVDRWAEETAHACHVVVWPDLAPPETSEEVARYPLSYARALLIDAAAMIAEAACGAPTLVEDADQRSAIIAHARAVLPPLGFADLLHDFENARPLAAEMRPPRVRDGLRPEVLAHARCPLAERRSLLSRFRAAIGRPRRVQMLRSRPSQ